MKSAEKGEFQSEASTAVSIGVSKNVKAFQAAVSVLRSNALRVNAAVVGFLRFRKSLFNMFVLP